MRIHLLSDLHQEAYRYYEVEEPGIDAEGNPIMVAKLRKHEWGDYDPMPGYTPPECDVVILAGDINEGLHGILWALETFKDVPVLYVPGNHEFYGYRANELLALMRKTCEGRNVQILANQDVVIDGVQFIGATLWTDFNLHGTAFTSALACEESINDFKFIGREDGRLITRFDVLEWNKRDTYFVSESLFHRKAEKRVVVTHFAPTERSSDPSWVNQRIGPYWATRMEELICIREPDVWVHGHMHTSADHMIWKTRILNNPQGNPKRHPNKNFNPGFIFEV